MWSVALKVTGDAVVVAGLSLLRGSQEKLPLSGLSSSDSFRLLLLV